MSTPGSWPDLNPSQVRVLGLVGFSVAEPEPPPKSYPALVQTSPVGLFDFFEAVPVWLKNYLFVLIYILGVLQWPFVLAIYRAGDLKICSESTNIVCFPEFYRHMSSYHHLPNVKLPMVFINALGR